MYSSIHLWPFVLFFAVASNAMDIFDAVRKNSAKDIEAAINSGENIDATGPGGQTPLMHAVLQGKEKSVAALLHLGADTSIGEKDGYTPMHGAGFQGRASIAKALIAHGLDPSDQHRDGFMPIHRACWGGEQRHTDTVKVLLESGVPFNLAAKNGETPLSAAKSHGNKKTSKLLKDWAAKNEL